MTAGGDARRGWDFFVSYTQADQAWAEWIAWTLEEDGYRVLVQAWDMVPGRNWVQDMQAGTRDAARTIAVLSGAYLESVYGGAEWQAAWASEPDGQGRRLLTVRVADCDRPGLLAGVVGADLFGLGEAAARTRLRDVVSAAVAGRAKPSERPGFPGAGRAVPREPRFPSALPAVWNVPARNPNFTGRGPELAALARGLAAGATVTVQAVRGMGGVGKTQLATEFAHARAGDYEVVWQVAAEEPAAIADQFTALAARLGLEPAADPEMLRAQVHDRLRAVAGWLLIFDNADTVADVRPWLPGGPMPAGVRGHAIMTTRRGGFGALGRVMDLGVIDLPDAVRLLRSRVPDLDQATGEQIAAELGRLPLALEQAAAYMDMAQLPGADYLDLLRTRAADLYERGQAGSRTDTIASLWRISLDRVAAQSPAAGQLLEVCAYLAPEPVPLDLFTAHADRLPQPLASAAADPVAFTDAVAVLVDYSLAKRSPAGLVLHRLIQAAARTRHDSLQAPGGTSPMSDAPGQQAGPAGDPLAVALALLRAGASGEITGHPPAWPRWAVLLPHVLAATAHPHHVAGPPGDAPRTDASWLLDRAGTYLRVHARLTDARPLLERARAIAEAVHGPDHPAVATALNNLATILRDLGRPGEARVLQERALGIGEAVYGPDHPGVATYLNNLALILRDLGRPGEARVLQERALGIAEAVYGPDHPGVATDLNNLALILQDLGRLEEARRLQERARAIRESARHDPPGRAAPAD